MTEMLDKMQIGIAQSRRGSVNQPLTGGRFTHADILYDQWLINFMQHCSFHLSRAPYLTDDAARETAEREKVHMRLAAYLVSVQRVAEAVSLRGWL